MEKKLLSIVVPVYNSKEYLEKCIDSILAQKYQPIEIVLVDDGSTDGSGEICDEYAKQFKNIVAFHQENGGQTRARKAGITCARGEYIGFVDADDWIEPDMYEVLMHEILREEADVITSAYIHETQNEKIIIRDSFEEGCYSQREIKEKILPQVMYSYETLSQGITGSLCNKVFRADIIKLAILEVNPELVLGEDAVLVYTIIPTVQKMIVTHYVGYHYVQHDNSAIHTYLIDDFEKCKTLHNSLAEIVKTTEEIGKQQLVYVTGPFLKRTLAALYNIEMNVVCCIPPYEIIPKGSKLIVYGAGVVGKSFVQALKMGEYAEIVGWVDKNYQQQDRVLQIENPLSIAEKDYDYILVAVLQEELAIEIKQQLIRAGIEENKILWKKVKMQQSFDYKCI